MSEQDGWPGRLQIPLIEDAIVGELAERGDWIVASVRTNSFWPVNAQKASFRERVVWILPISKNAFPAVAINALPGEAFEDCERLIMNFLSVLAWVMGHGYLVEGFTRGNLPRPMGRNELTGYGICEEFDLSYFPTVQERRTSLALALMREGRGLNHPAYAFLSFYRILEVAFPDGRKRKAWVTGGIDRIEDHRAKEALTKLKSRGIANVGDHLFESGRCAIAHARGGRIVDPDDPSDYRRLSAELPIVIALATMAIEEALGVETSQTVYKKHLYELEGFKEILGGDTVAYLTRGEQIIDERLVDIPNIDVQIRRRHPYKVLSNLEIFEIWQDGTKLFMRFESADKKVVLQFYLDFSTERLVFELENSIGVVDDGSPEAIETLIEIRRFEHEYFCNGQLQIFNSETGKLVSRKDAYIPVNMHFDDKAAAAGIENLKHLAKERRDRNARYHAEMSRYFIKYEVQLRGDVEGCEKPDKT